MPITLLGNISIALSLVVGTLSWKYLPMAFRWVFLQCLLAGLVELIGMKFNSNLEPNIWIYNLYMVGEPWLLGFAAMSILPLAKNRILLVLFLVTAFWCIQVLLYGLDSFANAVLLLDNFLFAVASIMILMKMSKQRTPFFQIPELWLAMAVLLFSAGNIPIMGLYNNLKTIPRDVAQNLYYITNILCILRYLFVTVAFLLIIWQKRNAANLTAYGQS